MSLIRLSVFVLMLAVNMQFASLYAQQMPKSWEEPLPSGPMSDDYPPGPDSQRQEGVPQGKIFNVPLEDSKIFPGTKRSIQVYVPAQYKGDKPACVYVALDGLGFNAPIVFDNLIHKGEIPLIIGIGVAPGSVPSGEKDDKGKDVNPRFNRSFEFDGLSNALGRFVIEEVFPAIESQKTPDGLPILLSKDPNDRCCGGGSTGGIGAFSLAWQRPDQFRRVFSAIGTFVCMRGGDRYPVLVRKTEPKPIRIFMQDGHHDQWGGGPEVGDWWIGNVALNRALEFSGYDVKHAWGTGPHSGKQATMLFPDAMRWLWRDYPEPLKPGTAHSLNIFLKQVVDPEKDWALATDQLKSPRNLAVCPKGNVFCRDEATQTIYRLNDDGSTTSIIRQPGSGGPMAFGADGKLYAADCVAKTISTFDPNAISPTWKEFASGIGGGGLTVLADGNLYVSDSEQGKVYLVKPDGIKTVQAEGLVVPSGVAAMPDGLWLAAVESNTHWGRSFRIEQDGTLTNGQRFYWFHVPDADEDLGNGDCCFDQDGRFYVATRLGVDVLDRNGRSRLLLPMPIRGGQAETTALCFGGENFDTLYVVSDGKVFKRTLKVKGAPNWKASAKLPGWGAG